MLVRVMFFFWKGKMDLTVASCLTPSVYTELAKDGGEEGDHCDEDGEFHGSG